MELKSVMEFITFIYNILEKDPKIGFLITSLFINVYLFRLVLKFNERYITQLKEIAGMAKEFGNILNRFKIKTRIDTKEIPIHVSEKKD